MNKNTDFITKQPNEDQALASHNKQGSIVSSRPQHHLYCSVDPFSLTTHHRWTKRLIRAWIRSTCLVRLHST
uniref:Uncharacterized protein n=1 Tax=Aegilops tauschii subsp. strangulata TaxID=200361 RepID=A0A453FDN6_AEGTS